jgi:hypothetical protein
MIKFIAFTCCATCEHKKEKSSSCHIHKTCDLDDIETDDYLVCGQWVMSEYLKKFTNQQ